MTTGRNQAYPRWQDTWPTIRIPGDVPASFVLSFLEATKPFLRGTLSGLAVFFAVSTACAQSADPQALGAAQAVFDDALRLMTELRYDEACPKLKDVTRLVPSGVGAKLQLGEVLRRGWPAGESAGHTWS